MSFFKKLIPKHTILGKTLRGDTKGAISSAKNYVKSGEILTDFKNISTGNFVAMAKKGIGGSVSSLLNKKPTSTLSSTNLSGGTSAASKQGSTPSVYSIADSVPVTSTTTADAPNPMDNKNIMYLGAAAVVIFLMLKK